MKTKTVLEHYRNEEETQRCTDVATIPVKYNGINPHLRTKQQIKDGKPSNVECYFSVTDDRWYARIPAVMGEDAEKNPIVITPAGEWVKVNTDNLIGLME
jgi:hypothetical protein